MNSLTVSLCSKFVMKASLTISQHLKRVDILLCGILGTFLSVFMYSLFNTTFGLINKYKVTNKVKS